jgi:sugar transferase (PEP-CTERM/EpsH1 system associated)
MKILYVVPYVPSLIRVRPYNLIRSLTALGHQVTVATLWTNEREQQDAEVLRAHCHEVKGMFLPQWHSWINSAKALPTRFPLQAVYSWFPPFAKYLDRLVQTRYDVVHVEHLRGVKYGLYLRQNHPNLPIVWDSVDCISLLFRWAAKHSHSNIRRWLTLFELKRTEKFEGQLANQFDRVLVTSSIDKQALVELASHLDSETKIEVLTNGVDLDYFLPNNYISRDPATLVVSGKMSYHANVAMVLYLVRDIMPHIWINQPNVILKIVGKDPTPDIQVLDKHKGIQVIGSVPDLRPYLHTSTIAVTPIRYGVGIQNKVLEAMACGTPVVSTPQAVSAIQVQNGRDVLVAHDAKDFADSVLSLLANPHQQQQIGLAGRLFVEKHHQWSKLAADLQKIYEEACNKRGN